MAHGEINERWELVFCLVREPKIGYCIMGDDGVGDREEERERESERESQGGEERG